MYKAVTGFNSIKEEEDYVVIGWGGVREGVDLL